ncbi:MAG: MoxR family ATPase [Bacteroidota bacterium]
MKNNPSVQPRAYTGEALKKSAPDVPRWAHEFDFEGKKFKGIRSSQTGGMPEQIDPYLPSPALKEAVSLMQILQRPLLLRGEPGCGKTKVAQAVAYDWYKDEELGYSRYYFEWHVKSSSKAQDGLYTFDHIAYLRDAHKFTFTPAAQSPDTSGDAQPKKEDLVKYRTLGPLGKAFLASEPGKPAILLIDEIDKADMDFPNDLLLELDEMRFFIRETGEEIVARQRPLIFITSNQERELPQAFLRRCLFHFIEFPEKEILESIIAANFPGFKTKRGGKTYSHAAIEAFKKLRDQLKANPTVNKTISTSELKDWVRLLEDSFLNGKKKKLPDEKGKLPFLAALIKTENDFKALSTSNA